MGFLDRYVNNLTDDHMGPYSLTDDDRKKLKRRGMLELGLQLLATPTGEGGIFQAFGKSALNASKSVQDSGQGMMRQRYQADQMTRQKAEFDKQKLIDGLAAKYKRPDGSMDMQGFRNELQAIDPMKFINDGADGVQSSFQGADGNMYAIGRDGTVKNLNVKFNPSLQYKTDSNNNPFAFDKTSGSMAPVGAPRNNSGLPIPETDKYVRNILFNAGPMPPNLSNEQKAERLLPHLIKQESGGNPNAVSPKGAQGLTQVMPATGQSPGYGVAPIRDSSSQENVRFGRDYLLAMLNEYGGDEVKALAAYNAGPGRVNQWQKQPKNPFMARTPEDLEGEKARAAAAAKAQVELATVAGIKTAEVTAAENAKNQATIGLDTSKKLVSAENVISLLDEAEPYLKGATNSGIGSMRDSVAGFFGGSTDGAINTAKLKPIAGQLVLMQPRMEGPQSDADRLLYQQMAGDLANDTIPYELRLAALQQMRQLAAKYLNRKGGGPIAPNDGPKRLKYNPATGKIE